MEQVIRKNIYSTFILKCYLKKTFGDHVPFEIINLISYFMNPKISIESSYDYALLLSDGELYEWGKVEEYLYFPRKVNLKNIISAKCNEMCSFTLDVNGNVYIWRFKLQDKSGNTHQDFYQTLPIEFGLKNIKTMECSSNCIFFLSKTGKVYVCKNIYNGCTLLLGTYITIFPGDDITIFITDSGRYIYYVNNIEDKISNEFMNDYTFQKLCLKTNTYYGYENSPVNFDKVEKVFFDESLVFITLKNGQIYSYGFSDDYCHLGRNNRYGSPDQNANDALDIFHEIKNLYNVAKISFGCHSAIALTKNNDVYTWGINNNGALGLYDNITCNQLESLPQKINITNIIDVAMGGTRSILVSKFGEIYVCGYDGPDDLEAENDDHRRNLSIPQKIPPIISYDWPNAINRSIANKRIDEPSLTNTDDICHKKRKL